MNYLENCKVGDSVYTRGWAGQIEIYKIVRETKTLFILNNNVRVKKASGRGDGSRSYYYQIDEKVQFEYKVQKLKRKIKYLAEKKIDITKDNFTAISNYVESLLTYIKG